MGKITKLSIEKLRENIKNGEYIGKVEYPKRPEGYKQPNYVYDENQTVKWNREQQEYLTECYQNDLAKFHAECNRVELLFFNDLKKMLVDTFGFSVMQVETISCKAWDDGHADGLENVVNQAIELADFAQQILEGVEE